MNDKNAFSTLLTVLITAVTVGVLTGVISYSYAASKKDLEIEDLKEQLSQVKEGTQTQVEAGSMNLDTSGTDNQQPTTNDQRATATPSTTTDETTNWKTYANDKYGFSFKYPGEWRAQENVKTFGIDSIATISAIDGNESYPIVISYYNSVSDIESYPSPKYSTLKDYASDKNQFLSFSESTVANRRAYEAVMIADMYSYSVLIEKDNHIYEIDFINQKKDRKALLAIEKRFLSTFQFTK